MVVAVGQTTCQLPSPYRDRSRRRGGTGLRSDVVHVSGLVAMLGERRQSGVENRSIARAVHPPIGALAQSRFRL